MKPSPEPHQAASTVHRAGRPRCGYPWSMFTWCGGRRGAGWRASSAC